jgi:ABC-type antimicrobial peptide transport system permease subunit
LAILIASPLAYYFMDGWLQDFEYHVEMKWWVFVLAGMLAMVITMITISFHAIKAAMADPVKSLRTE